MIRPVDIGVCEEQKYNKKGVYEHCRGCICCDPPPGCSLKSNHIGYKIRYRYQYAAHILTNKDNLQVSESENKRRKMNRKTAFRVKDIMILTEIFNLCDDGKHLPNKEKLIKICNFLGVEVNSCDEIPKSGCNMESLYA